MKLGVFGRAAVTAAGVAVALFAATSANAGLIGDTVQLDYIFPDQSTVFETLGQSLVNPTALFNSFGQHNYLVTDNTLQITNTTGGSVTFTSATFNGIELTDLSNANITDVTIDSASNLSGLDASRLSFDGSHIFLNLVDLVTEPSTLVQLDITTGATTAAVPEPTTLGLFGAALVGVGWLRRRK